MDHYGLTRTVEPATLPITLEEANGHLELIPGDRSNDALVLGLIAAATDHVETETHRQLVTATWRFQLPAFPGNLQLPRPPLISVDKIDYIDAEGTSIELDSAEYSVFNGYEPALIAPALGKEWPTTAAVPNAVTVTYQAGYATVPQGLKQAILLMVAHWFENREAVTAEGQPREVPLAAQRLVQNYQVGEEFLIYA